MQTRDRSTRFIRLLAAGAAVAAVLGGALGTGGGFEDPAPAPALALEPLSFNRDIRPILADKCFACHGPDGAARKAELRLDRREEAVEPRRGRTPIVPGDPSASELVRRLYSADPDEVMPPPESKLALTDGERETLRRWIEEGAVYERHWAFQPLPATIPVPGVGDAGWCRDPLDRFVLARLESEGLTPSPEASRERWLRRVSYDLTGLPPSPEQAEAFLSDESEGAHERVVDRLLESPHFGERMAVPWLDAARYADSYGYQSDLLSPTWPWRDWVVRAFNDGMPYDEFLTRQLAGDLLPEATRDDRLATAFNRLHRMTNEGGSIPEEWRVEYAADRVETFASAALGLTMQCARCHDHKYDPVTQREYYSLAAYFNSIDEHGLYESTSIVPTPSMLLPTYEQGTTLAYGHQDVRKLEARLLTLGARQESAFREWLGGGPYEAIVPDLVGRFRFDEIGEEGLLENDIAEGSGPGRIHAGSSTHPPRLVESPRGRAVRLDGDNLAHVPGLGDIDRWTPFTVALWVRDTSPEPGPRVLAHRSSGTDAGPYGFDLMLEGGAVTARAFRHWPGNAIAAATVGPVVSENAWTHIVWAYDGSSSAAGFSLWINGEPAELRIVRNRVWKTIGGGGTYGPGGHDLILGQRFRDSGMAGGEFDEVVIVRRAVSDIEARHLFDGAALEELLVPPLEARAGRPYSSSPLRDYYFNAIDPEIRATHVELAAARRAFAEAENAVAEIMVMEELPEPRPTHVLERGEYDAPTGEHTLVERGLPQAIMTPGSTPPLDRLELARAVTASDHPLGSRVAVNRLWQICFGTGLVATSDNLGVQGSPPSHPELLDYLAREFVGSGWDTKAMLRRVVLSATYRQDSTLTAVLRERDPADALLARYPSRRLAAEMVRDTALAASGLLVREIGGAPVSPYQPPGLWREFNGFSPAYAQGSGDALHRRSLYTVWKRTAPMPSMLTFDAPGREACVVRRSETNTPLQALVLLNDVQFVEAARALAQEAMGLADEDGDRVTLMFRRCAVRSPGPAESDILLGLLADQRDLYAADPDAALALVGLGESPRDESLDPGELAALTVVAQAILNLDATVWQR